MARNALFCCQNAVFDVFMSIRGQRSKDGGSRPLFNNAHPSSFLSLEPAIGPAISLYHDERAPFMSDCPGQIRPDREVATDNPSWHFFVLVVADFRMRESRAKVRHSDQTQGDSPRNAPHVQCEQTDYFEGNRPPFDQPQFLQSFWSALSLSKPTYSLRPKAMVDLTPSMNLRLAGPD